MLNTYRYQEIIFEPLKVSDILGEDTLEPGADDPIFFSIYARVDVNSALHM